MILFLSTADTDLLSVERARALLPAGFPAVRCANPARPGALEPWPDGVRAVVARLLGGERALGEAWQRLRDRCREEGIPLVALAAGVDGAGAAAVEAPSHEIARRTAAYLEHGGVENMANMLRFVAHALLGVGAEVVPPIPMPEAGVYRPAREVAHRPDRPTVGVVFYRAHWLSGNTEFVDALVEALEEAGANALGVFCPTLRPDSTGRVPAHELLRGRVDALVVTVLAAGGSTGADGLAAEPPDGAEGWRTWWVPWMEALDVPVVQGICATWSREAWDRAAAGLPPLDVAMQVAIPEFDGRIVGVPLSFKEPLAPGSPVTVYRADPERARRLAGIAVALARLRRLPAAERRVAIVLSNYPSAQARIGNAVGLDAPASAIRLLCALREAGYRVDGCPESGDALVHALIAAGAGDPEGVTDEQLARAPVRLDAGLYARWFDELPEAVRRPVVDHWGPPPGEFWVHDGAIGLPVLRYGNIVVCVQPARGFGQRPVAIYHDPDLPPPHHYLATYLWLRRAFGAHALVHLGKHGTLEWLPGKSVGLSAGCAPDAVLGDVPLVYPFIVNDPGEGTQAKRRTHAVIVDHLVPPMVRAETYDDLARLEQLLDEYAQLQLLDPAKLPVLQQQIWEVVQRASLHRDLGLAGPPDDFDAFCQQLDGYLCELKDRRIRGGLHVLGEVPTGEGRLGLLAGMLRLGMGSVPGLRRAVAGVFGLEEPALAAQPGRRVQVPPALQQRFPGPAATAADVLDRLEEASRALLEGMERAGWRGGAAREVCARVLGCVDEGVVRALEFCAREVVPRLDRTPDEIAGILRALEGRFVPSGPAGSPTRGAVDVLPTGRNFYSVDPKAIPSPAAWDTGRRLADELLARARRDGGGWPETVGIVVWGTANMRTQGDDVAEILALLGVRPLWDEVSRRVVGTEVVPLEELGRPRIDVCVRISGFFRDAFPELVGLLDDAIRRVAALEEPEEANFVAKHARAERAAGTPERWATVRIFGSKPGAYGAGMLPLLDARTWRDDADLARVYEVWGGYAYGRGLDGAEAREAMRRVFGRVQVAVKNVDTAEHDLLDSDDYFQYHGGMVATVRALTGSNPLAVIGDSTDPGAVRTRSLAEEVCRVMRARALNPRWIQAMSRHGYKGAFELAATVDYLFGYDATAGVAEDWMYEAVAERYVLDPRTAAWVLRSNPWAARAMAERLLEAAERGLWRAPREEMLQRLRQALLEAEAVVEGEPA